MELRQLRTLITLVDNDFSVSRTAEELFLVQSAVSQQLKRLEKELDSEIFIRKGKRLTGLTEFGKLVEQQAHYATQSVRNIQSMARDARQASAGVLRIGCTHTQARYILPPVIRRFNRNHPQVELQMHQGNPRQLVEWAARDVVDFSICTEELAESDKLQSLPCYRWNRCLIALPDHPLLQTEKLRLADLCKYPVITYVMGFTGRKSLDETFHRARLKPNTVLSAADTDIIKTYVQQGLGIGIITTMAFDAELDAPLCARDLSELFPWEVTRIAYLKNKYIHREQQTFVDLFLETIRADQSARFEAL